MVTREKKIMRISLNVSNRETLVKFMRDFQLDIGGVIRSQPDGTLNMEVYTPEEVLNQLRGAGAVFEIIEDATKIGIERQKEVGRGDRFEGGKKAPQGLGKKE